MTLAVRALSVSRGYATLFRDVSFEVAAGERIALRGANGSGKTTLLRCVAGLTRADSGAVERTGRVLYAGHLPGINDDLTAPENLAFSLRLNGLAPGAEAIAAALAAVGLEKRTGLPARRLSAGQRRRIGLARLALDDAAVWLLDEPLSALDAEGERLLGERLAAHQRRGGCALIATHHDLPGATSREIRL